MTQVATALPSSRDAKGTDRVPFSIEHARRYGSDYYEAPDFPRTFSYTFPRTFPRTLPYTFVAPSRAPGPSSQSQASLPPPEAKDHKFTEAELQELNEYRDQIRRVVDSQYKEMNLQGAGLYEAGLNAATTSMGSLKRLVPTILVSLPKGEKLAAYKELYNLMMRATHGIAMMEQGIQAMQSPAEYQEACDALHLRITSMWKQVWATPTSLSTLEQIAEWEKRNKGKGAS